MIKVDHTLRKNVDGTTYNFYSCLVADHTGSFYFEVPDFRVDEKLLLVDNVLVLRNAKCYKDRESNAIKITIDRWGKVLSE